MMEISVEIDEARLRRMKDRVKCLSMQIGELNNSAQKLTTAFADLLSAIGEADKELSMLERELAMASHPAGKKSKLKNDVSFSDSHNKEN